MLIIRVLLRSNEELFAQMPHAAEYLAQLDAVLEDILQLKLEQKIGKADKEKEYNKLKEALITTLVEILKKLRSYATFSKNAVLLELVGITDKQLAKMDDDNLIELAKRTYQKINDLMQELVIYKLTDDSQKVFIDTIADFEVISPEFSKTKKSMKLITSSLSDLFKQSDEILLGLDAEVDLISTTAPKFVKDYNIQRKLTTTTELMQLVGHIKDAVTGKPIQNASIILQAEGKTTISKVSAEKGGFLNKTLDPAIYTVTAEKIGYQPKTMTITVTGDAPYNLNIELDPM